MKICKGISYAAVAAHADKSGRRKLAAMLVEHEPRSSKQVKFKLFLVFLSIRHPLKDLIISLLHVYTDMIIFIYGLNIIPSLKPYLFDTHGNFCTNIHILISQIPLLLSIGEENSALVKATESGDTDLVYLVMFHIWKKV